MAENMRKLWKKKKQKIIYIKANSIVPTWSLIYKWMKCEGRTGGGGRNFYSTKVNDDLWTHRQIFIYYFEFENYYYSLSLSIPYPYGNKMERVVLG